MIIEKSDFQGIVNFSVNVTDATINFHILDAQQFDLEPRCPDDFYLAIQEIPSPSDELYDFVTTFVKPLLVCWAYQRFLLWAGRNITQYGIRVNNEETSNEVTDKGRAELINDIKSKTNVYLARFWKELKDVDYTFDGVTYNFDCEDKKPSIKIMAV